MSLDFEQRVCDTWPITLVHEVLLMGCLRNVNQVAAGSVYSGHLRGKFFLLFFVVSLATSCAAISGQVRSLPPILTQEQLVRPYVKVGIVEVFRDRYGSVEYLSPADYDWAYQSLREEAQKVGADAVILPEVRANMTSYILFPASEISAKATAIKFR